MTAVCPNCPALHRQCCCMYLWIKAGVSSDTPQHGTFVRCMVCMGALCGLVWGDKERLKHTQPLRGSADRTETADAPSSTTVSTHACAARDRASALCLWRKVFWGLTASCCAAAACSCSVRCCKYSCCAFPAVRAAEGLPQNTGER